ncbi:MAG TPA: serine/threonine-protein kinase [Gemmatimonadales bacterium]|jgi:serine/threonine-protein kinase
MKPELHARVAAGLADRYTVERELGRGGMATVLLAKDLQHDRPVALKILLPELAQTLGADRFKREIRVAARLQHPNILHVLDSGEVDGQLWFAMPFVEGESVWDRLKREHQLPPAEALRITLACTSALAYAHDQGVIHRDIKPENILLSGEQVLVADFGVARAVSEMQDKLTATGMVVGTPTYMSPEQASGDKQIDGRSDIFALGCVLYEMLAGEAPFKGPTPQATLMRRFTGPPRALLPLINISESVEQAIMRSLARDPADRFATAAEFSAALQGKATSRPQAQAAPATPTGSAAGRKGCSLAVLAAVSAGALGLTLLLG